MYDVKCIDWEGEESVFCVESEEELIDELEELGSLYTDYDRYDYTQFARQLIANGEVDIDGANFVIIED